MFREEHRGNCRGRQHHVEEGRTCVTQLKERLELPRRRERKEQYSHSARGDQHEGAHRVVPTVYRHGAAPYGERVPRARRARSTTSHESDTGKRSLPVPAFHLPFHNGGEQIDHITRTVKHLFTRLHPLTTAAEGHGPQREVSVCISRFPEPETLLREAPGLLRT